MPREARRAPGILKNNHMEHAAKALKSDKSSVKTKMVELTARVRELASSG